MKAILVVVQQLKFSQVLQTSFNNFAVGKCVEEGRAGRGENSRSGQETRLALHICIEDFGGEGV